MRHTMTVTALTAALLVSTAAYAETASVKATASLDSLPDKGVVSVDGVVDRVVDGDTFVLRDSAGDTVDVHTKADLALTVGDSVSVKGEKASDLAGLGEEIENATVSVTSKGTAAVDTTTEANPAPRDAKANTDAKKTAAYDMDTDVEVDADADVNQVAKAGEITAAQSGNVAAKAETPRDAKSNTEAKKTASYDLDADVDVKAAGDVAKVADAGEMTAEEANKVEMAKADADAKATTVGEDIKNTASNVKDSITNSGDAAVAGTIAALPKEGSVSLTGTVDRVSNDNKFILRDSEGKTIDIHTASNVNVEPGDKVSVNGNVKSELLGFGRQIESAQVLKVSAAR